MHLYPIQLNLEGKLVLVVGQNKVADSKIVDLTKAGAQIKQIPSDKYSASELAQVWLVVAATQDPALNAQILEDASKSQIWTNSADDPPNCTAILPAVFRRGPLVVSVSTSGLSPAFSVWLRNQLEAATSPNYEILLHLISEVREDIRRKGDSSELFKWQTTLDLAISKGIIDLLGEGKRPEAKELLLECLFSL